MMTFVVAFFLSHLSAICTPISSASDLTIERRKAETCADPTIALVYVEAYSPSLIAHDIFPLYVFVHADSVGGSDWFIQNQLFCGWTSAQAFTIPLYQLVNPTTNDYMFLTSTTGSAPVVAGYTSSGVVSWVYSTQVCGSVPLYAAFEVAVGDHWYTTSAISHSALLASGWVDAGIPAYVLPLTGACLSN